VPKGSLTNAVSVRAGKHVVIRTSVYGGVVDIRGDTITIADNLVIDGRDSVTLAAAHEIDLGDQIRLSSRGSTLTPGAIAVTSTAGSVFVGTRLQVTSLGTATLAAGGGNLALGSGSRMTSSRASVSLTADTDILADGVQLTAWTKVSIAAGDATADSVSLRSARVSVSTTAQQGGSIAVSAPRGTIDVRGAAFSRVSPQLTAATVITVDPPVTPPPPPPPPSPPAGSEYIGPTIVPRAAGDHLDAEERALLVLLNQIRTQNGRPAFWAVSTRLTQAADWHSRDMYRTGSVGHTSSNGWGPGDRFAWFGWNSIIFSQPAGEIVYAGGGNTSVASAQAAVQWWMNSSGHRAQILTAAYAHVGIGRACNAGATLCYWTVDFTAQPTGGTSIDGGAVRAWDLGYIAPGTP
jgi:uncharacterized protein YkwD